MSTISLLHSLAKEVAISPHSSAWKIVCHRKRAASKKEGGLWPPSSRGGQVPMLLWIPLWRHRCTQYIPSRWVGKYTFFLPNECSRESLVDQFCILLSSTWTSVTVGLSWFGCLIWQVTSWKWMRLIRFVIWPQILLTTCGIFGCLISHRLIPSPPNSDSMKRNMSLCTIQRMYPMPTTCPDHVRTMRLHELPSSRQQFQEWGDVGRCGMWSHAWRVRLGLAQRLLNLCFRCLIPPDIVGGRSPPGWGWILKLKLPVQELSQGAYITGGGGDNLRFR